MRVLAFDPSGNWGSEGMGTSGYAIFDRKWGDSDNECLVDFGELKAKAYPGEEYYWDAHIKLIIASRPEIIAYETYALQAGKAVQQSWSHLQTPQLIGLLKWHAMKSGIKCVGRSPSLVKGRFSDDVLVNMGLAERTPRGHILIKGKQTNAHMRDAIRHGLYQLRYGKKEE